MRNHSNAHTIAATVISLALASMLLASCELDGASKKPRTDNSGQNSSADVRRAAPRSSFPMPPVESAHQTNSRPRGWTMLDGRRAKLDDFRGQAVVLDFYATYCPPCLEEIPHLVTLQRRYGNEGLKVIGLNVGGEEDQAKVPAFVQRFSIQYSLGNPDWEFVDTMFSGNSTIPQTMVYDREGRLVKHFTGYDPEVATQLEQAIQTALATKTAKDDDKSIKRDE